MVFSVKWQDGVLVQEYRAKDDLIAFGDDREKLAHVAMKSDARVRGIELKTEEDMLNYLPKWLLSDQLHLGGNDGQSSQADLAELPAWYLAKKSKQHKEVSAFM